VKFDLATSALLGRVNHAGIEWPRVDMQAHCAIVELPRIIDAMYRILRIDRAGMLRVHLHGVGRLQFAPAAV
jgi:hypothetical protein